MKVEWHPIIYQYCLQCCGSISNITFSTFTPARCMWIVTHKDPTAHDPYNFCIKQSMHACGFSVWERICQNDLELVVVSAATWIRCTCTMIGTHRWESLHRFQEMMLSGGVCVIHAHIVALRHIPNGPVNNRIELQNVIWTKPVPCTRIETGSQNC